MEIKFVNYELALNLKEKGFSEDCLAYYYPSGKLVYNWVGDDTIEKSGRCNYNDSKIPITNAPTLDQVLNWLLDEKKCFIEVVLGPNGFDANIYCNVQWVFDDNDELIYNFLTKLSNNTSSNQAYELGIKYILEEIL